MIQARNGGIRAGHRAGAGRGRAQRASGADETAGAPLLWQGRLGTHHISLFGTIHVPDARVLALSASVRGAFNRADRVVTEMPLDTARQAELAAALLLPEGQRLRAIVGDALFARLEARVRAALTPTAPEVAPLVASMLNRLKPWAALAQLATLEYLPDLLAGRTSLDAQLYADAVATGKKVGSSKPWRDRASTFDAFSPQEQATLLEEALRDLETPAGPSGPQLVEWYLEGNGGGTSWPGPSHKEAATQRWRGNSRPKCWSSAISAWRTGSTPCVGMRRARRCSWPSARCTWSATTTSRSYCRLAGRDRAGCGPEPRRTEKA